MFNSKVFFPCGEYWVFGYGYWVLGYNSKKKKLEGVPSLPKFWKFLLTPQSLVTHKKS
jgi:hypothetical protein